MTKNKEDTLCLECPVRGICCYYSVEIEGHNLILYNQPCKFLDINTGLCTTYETRLEYDWCGPLDGYGGLPKECLYLIEHPELETFHKEDIRKIADKISKQGIMRYNVMNNLNDIENYRKMMSEEE